MKSGICLFLMVFLLFAVMAAAQPVMSVKITSPSNQDQFAKCSEVVVTVDPQIQGGEIKSVTLYRNNVGVTSRSKAPWEFKLKNQPSGYYVFTAKITAKTNEFVISDPVAVYVGDAEKGNILMNGEFDCGQTPWTLQVQGGAVASLQIDTTAEISSGAAAVVTIENGGTADWHIQLQQPFAVDSGHTYVVFFTAQTDQNSMPITMYFQENGGAYSVYNSVSATVEALQDYGPFTFESSRTDHVAYLRINLGTYPNATVWIDAIQVYDESLTGLKDRKPSNADAMPSMSLLSRNYPNPFNPGTTIQYRLPAEGSVTLSVFNLKGQEARTLVRENQAPGDHQARWNGDDGSGKRLPSGVYVYRLRLKTADRVSTLSRKIMLLQ